MNTEQILEFLLPRLYYTDEGIATYGGKPIEAVINGKKMWLADDGGLIQGVYLNLPEQDYHAIKDVYSSSGLKKFATDAHVGEEAYYGVAETKEPSPLLQRSFNAGHLIHGLILEPHLNDYGIRTPQTMKELEDDGYFVIENHDDLKTFIKVNQLKAGTKIDDKVVAAKEIVPSLIYYPHYLDGLKNNTSSRFLNREDYNNCLSVAEKFKETEIYKKNFEKGGYSELTIIAFDPERGVWCKARLDRVNDLKMMLDLKTIHTLSVEQIRRDIEDKLYAIQGAFYHHVAELAGFDLVQNSFALTFIEWDLFQRFQLVEISDRGWKASLCYMHEIFDDFVDWIWTTENKNSINYSATLVIDPTYYKLSRRIRVQS